MWAPVPRFGGAGVFLFLLVSAEVMFARADAAQVPEFDAGQTVGRPCYGPDLVA